MGRATRRSSAGDRRARRRRRPATGDRIVDLAIAPDAIVDLDGWGVPGGDAAGRPAMRSRRAAVDRAPARPAVLVEVELVDAATGEPVPGPGPVHRRRRSLPAAREPSRRGEPGLLRGHRRRPGPRRVAPTPTSPARSRSGCRRPRSRSRRSRGFDRRPIRTDGHGRPPDPPARARRSSGRSTCRRDGGSPPTATSISSPPSTALLQAARRGRRPGEPPGDPVGRPRTRA